MSCSKKGCENIMCDTYVSNIGYVCTDCQTDFQAFLGGKTIRTEEKMREKLEKFMREYKGRYIQESIEGITTYEFFKQYTK